MLHDSATLSDSLFDAAIAWLTICFDQNYEAERWADEGMALNFIYSCIHLHLCSSLLYSGSDSMDKSRTWVLGVNL